VPESPESGAPEPQVALKDPLVAGVLAWLVPGLGHLYQGRYGKAALFSTVILCIFVWGLWMGSSPENGRGRDVYFSVRKNDLRLYYFCQMGIGLPAVTALFQADRMHSNKPPLCKALMAPPKLKPEDPPGGLLANDPAQRTLHEVMSSLGRWFELGTIYTAIAGLLNVLAIYDAACGPVLAPAAKKEEDDDEAAPAGPADETTPAEKPE
jgi:TM2 domain-containing membrane protein YozV